MTYCMQLLKHCTGGRIGPARCIPSGGASSVSRLVSGCLASGPCCTSFQARRHRARARAQSRAFLFTSLLSRSLFLFTAWPQNKGIVKRKRGKTVEVFHTFFSPPLSRPCPGPPSGGSGTRASEVVCSAGIRLSCFVFERRPTFSGPPPFSLSL
jgi:hypothetical protein